MYIKLFINHLLKHFKYAAAVMIVLLSAIPINADAYFYPYYKTKEKLGLSKDEPQARMFLITVVDSHDETIGKRCERDLDEVTYTFEQLADWLDVQMTAPKIVDADNFSKAGVNDAIDNWLKSQQLNKTDIVVFYYSGHGFRYPNDVSDYPRMWLKTAIDQNVATNNLRIEDVYDRITKMGAGVNIVLSDCCNTTTVGDNRNFDNVPVPVRPRAVRKREHPKDEDSDDDMDNGDKLFIPQHPLSILATAAAKDEFAAGKSDTGGFFTNYLLDALEDCIYDEKIEPTWESIFQYADENAGYWAKSAACPEAKHNEQGRCVQTIKFRIDTSD
jgi:hypothetical protein